MTGLFEDQVAIVSGGASLIGKAIARRLADDGATVVIGDADTDNGEQAAARIGERALFVVTDVTDDQALEHLVETAVADHGRLDVVVSAAAIFDDEQLDTSRELWHRALDINLIGAARLTALAAPHMTAGGAIAYIASVSAGSSQPNRVVYNVTKAALVMLAKTAAQQLAPRGIRVNAVSPGWTWSRNIEGRYGSRERADEFAAEFQPLGRMADPEEVADAVAFVTSDQASFMTGSELMLDGGYSALGPEALGQALAKVPPLT